MSQSGITCFLSVARTGSFAETARELYMTRQAVSKNIQDLENEVGFPLFFRRCSPLTLTTAGEKLRQYYKDSCENLNIAKRVLGEDGAGVRSLRIGWGRWFMPNSRQIDALKDFGMNSEVRLRVAAGTEMESLEYLRTGEIDVAFLSKYVCSMLREPYHLVALSEEPIRVVTAHSRPVKSVQDMEALMRELPYLVCPAGESNEKEILGRVHRAMMYFQCSPGEIRIMDNLETILLQVLLDKGFTCLPNAYQEDFGLRTQTLPEKDGVVPSVTMCMVWLSRNQNPEIPRLRDWMLEKCEGADD